MNIFQTNSFEKLLLYTQYLILPDTENYWQGKYEKVSKTLGGKITQLYEQFFIECAWSERKRWEVEN